MSEDLKFLPLNSPYRNGKPFLRVDSVGWTEGFYEVEKTQHVNSEVRGKSVRIDKTVTGTRILSDSRQSDYFSPKKVSYDFEIGNKTYQTSFDCGDDDEHWWFKKERLHYAKRAILEKEELVALAHREDFSPEQLMMLEFNLNARSQFSEALRNFTTFEDLQEKIYQNPEHVDQNLKVLTNLYETVRHGRAYMEAKGWSPLNNRVTESAGKLGQMMRNLMNTDNHEFNKKVVNNLEKIFDARTIPEELVKRKHELENIDLCNSKLGKLRKKIAKTVDTIGISSDLTDKKIPKPIKKLEKAVSDKILGKSRD